jgi:hypothetical protein
MQEKDYSLEDIEKLFNEGIERQNVGPCETAIKSYLSGNYISEKSIAFSQIYIKAAMLDYVTYGGWNYHDARDIAKAFICIFENAKRKSVQAIDTEINIAYATIVELLTKAMNTPFVKSMKDPYEILKVTQFLINLYCFCPTTIDEYIEELLSYLSRQNFSQDENNKKNDLISFFEKAQAKVFNSGYVDLEKFKAYNSNEYKAPKLDTVTIKYYNENEGTCIFDVDFIESPCSKIDIVVSALDVEKHPIPFDTNSQDYEFHIPYENDSAYKCGMLRISKTIFGFPKQAKFLEVKLNSQKIICEFNINNLDDREFIIQDNILKKYIGQKTKIEIPKGVINIGEEAFKNCENIVSVILPNGLLNIEALAFYGCTRLNEIYIPNTVKTIGEIAFAKCSSLEKINIPDSVKNINDAAFSDCTSLNEITLPKDIENMGSDVFRNCNLLFNEDGMLIINDVLYSYNGNAQEISIPDNVVVIGQYAFYYNNSLKSLIIPQGCKRIDSFALKFCRNLETLVFQGDLETINASAFIGCGHLSTIVIPDSITTIESRVFRDCYSLKSIILPNNIENIGEQAFYNCAALTSFTVPDSVATIDEQAFCHCESLTSINIPNSVCSIKPNAFEFCKNLKTVYFNSESQKNKFANVFDVDVELKLL